MNRSDDVRILARDEVTEVAAINCHGALYVLCDVIKHRVANCVKLASIFLDDGNVIK